MPSIYEQINQRADAIKCQRWREYIALTKLQLTDYDMVSDEDQPPEDMAITLIAITTDPNPALRSTQRSAKPYKQFRIIKRPTEVRAIMHANGVLILDDDFDAIETQPIEETRWCIRCKSRHPLAAFVRHKRYLHKISYVCEDKLKHGLNGRRWRMIA